MTIALQTIGLFKQFGGVDSIPICLDTQDVDEIVAAVCAIAPVFAPRRF